MLKYFQLTKIAVLMSLWYKHKNRVHKNQRVKGLRYFNLNFLVLNFEKQN